MRCNLFAIKNQMFKCGDVWDRQYRGLNGAVVINGKDTPLGQWSRPYWGKSTQEGGGLSKIIIIKKKHSFHINNR